ncbi:unnamed protein product [Ambrosiozyma monospora]|uniref:Unnamed protein product n=1 Tax=Ambrosiozyma monospora TaxID=43982 RepID=A0ACB5T1M5_AMBMO|nr:unnamed protein product [Ambrosiozyma monospora]
MQSTCIVWRVPNVAVPAYTLKGDRGYRPGICARQTTEPAGESSSFHRKCNTTKRTVFDYTIHIFPVLLDPIKQQLKLKIQVITWPRKGPIIMKFNLGISNYVNLVSSLPLELKQAIIIFSLLLLDKENQSVKQPISCESAWIPLQNAISFVCPKPGMTINISSHDTKVYIHLRRRQSILFLQQSHTSNSGWIKNLNEFNLQELNVSTFTTRNFASVNSQRGLNTFVQLINSLSERFDIPEFSYNEFSPNSDSYLLSSADEFDWIKSITSYKAFASVAGIDQLYHQRERFNKLEIVTLVALPSFIAEFDNFEQLEALSHSLHKLILNVQLYQRHSNTNVHLFEFLVHTDIEIKVDCLSGPLDYEEDDIVLDRADKIGHFLAETKGTVPLSQVIKMIPSRLEMIDSMTIAIDSLHNFNLRSSHLKDLRINCKTCKNVDLSLLSRLQRLSFNLFGSLDRETVSTIPVSAVFMSH